MSQITQLKEILYRMVQSKVLANEKEPRTLNINLKEISRELRCTANEVEMMLKHLKVTKEIKALIQVGFSKEEYTLTVPENSSILNL